MIPGEWFEDVEGYDDDNEGEPLYEPAAEPERHQPRGGGLRGVMDRVSRGGAQQRGLLEAHEAMVNELMMLGVEVP